MYCTLRSSTRPRWFCYILTKSDCRSRQLTDCTPPAVHQCTETDVHDEGCGGTSGQVGSDLGLITQLLEKKREKPAPHSFSGTRCALHTRNIRSGHGTGPKRLKMGCCAKASTGVNELVTAKFLPHPFFLFLTEHLSSAGRADLISEASPDMT